MTAFAEPSKWAETLGSNADYNEIPETTSDASGAASRSQLFPPITQVPLSAGGVAPSRMDYNGLLKLLGDNIYFQQQGGKYTYDSTITYSLGSIVLYNGKLYQSLVADNTAVPTDTAKWSQLPTLAEMQAALKALTPSGTIIAYAGSSIPSGYLLCNGAAIFRTTYASLYSAIGTTYGTGDGSTTFNLPDLRDRVLQGYSSSHALGSYLSAGLPNITGRVSPAAGTAFCWSGTLVTIGAFELGTDTGPHANSQVDSATPRHLYFDASLSNSTYSATVTTVQPAALSTQYLIKY